MKTFLENSLASLLRFALTAFAAWVAAQSGYEFVTGDASALTLFQFVTGLVLVGLVVGLKYLDGTKYGTIGRLLIGPRVLHLSASIARLIVAAISAAVASLANEGTFDTLEPGLGDDPVVGLVVVLLGFAYDRVSKSLSP